MPRLVRTMRAERRDWTTRIGGHGRAEPIEGQSETEVPLRSQIVRPFSFGSGSRVTLACCKVGLDRPLIPTAFVANLLRSPRVARPTVRPTGGLQVRCRRSGTGRPAVAEDGRVRRPLPEPAFEVPGSGLAWLAWIPTQLEPTNNLWPRPMKNAGFSAIFSTKRLWCAES